MTATTCSIVCFSPTASTRKIAEAIAGGTGLPVTVHDLTLPQARDNKTISFTAADLVVLTAPVYFGRVPRTATAAFSMLKADKSPAIVAVNYGNRHYDDALLELFDQACTIGFTPLVAGAFVSRHSFHTEACPMAPGRPDETDLKAAVRLGRSAREALSSGAGPALLLPGNRPYRPYPELFRAPVTTETCTQCGLCVPVCPVGAIALDRSGLNTNEKSCIICQACVAACPQKARQDTGPGAAATRERLAPLVRERREVELFLSR